LLEARATSPELGLRRYAGVPSAGSPTSSRAPRCQRRRPEGVTAPRCA
jgi:hypothetical protein